MHTSDIVYHLGDFSFEKNAEKTIALLNRLNGNKRLLKGNHDSSDNFKKYKQAKSTEIYDYLENQFLIDSRDASKKHIVMFHFPIGSWHKQGYGSWHLHGHSHGNYQEGKGKILDVGIDNAYNLTGKHQFFDLKMIEDYMITREVYISDLHRSNL